MTSLRSRLQHRLNPLHVYCRLRSLGLAHRPALMVSSCWERVLYRRILS
ncbi:hypothetical protein DND132_1471 [Pseudodesulfovibrio mercurii]|uniref:Uncharacterized protein n=1 Tax=Pseudodesulfovibrio mercurii TaxID=641491 RepID=F0JE70_9BACT|nr:hypothetical protein [Pseudodesulfovibrio mercurii]EGB14679.1 hypothetical protein DND132_1471 [Pseudodesulfovibrio mercurii]